MKNARIVAFVTLLVAIGRPAGGEQAAKESAEDAAARARREKMQMAVQAICPVSGNKLGEHGAPVKVAVGEHKEEVYLCCKGCATGEIDPQHWATIHANFARAQRICPVMEHKLPRNPKWTIVEGKIIYVCCPPCIKKIDASPAKYLQKVDELYLASLRAAEEQTRR